MIRIETEKVHVGQGTCEKCGKESVSKSSKIAPFLYQVTENGNPIGKKQCGVCIGN